MRLRYHPEARAELNESAEWYAERGPGLGLDFVAEVEGALASVRENPERWPRWPGIEAGVVIRKFVLRRFPFAIAYMVHEDAIVVLAVAHGKRRPGYWLSRLDRVAPP